MPEHKIRVETLTRAMMRRALRLLDMEYKPSELAEELHTTTERIKRLVAAGCPARQDANGHYWIHGTTLFNFLENAAPKKKTDKHEYSENEVYCMVCRKVVPYTTTRRSTRIVYGLCPDGHKTARFISNKPQGKDGKNVRRSNKTA